MRKHSNKGVLSTIFILVIIGLLAFNSQNYKGVFTRELNDFFGKGNWEYVGKEDKETSLYMEVVEIGEDLTKTVKGKYSNYLVKYKDDVYKISTFKNNLSKKVWAVRQIMDMATDGILSDYLYENILLDVYSPALADIFRVQLCYENGNPKPDFYKKLDELDWFKADLIKVEDFLSWEEAQKYNFHIYIRTFDYKVEKLTDSEKVELYNGYSMLIKNLLDTYGEDASFEILIDDDHWVKYKNGVKVDI